ncbi:hypothetical protein BGZ97_010213 [Linnemannia gamsii]|uniref:RNI-like protein n=1 Tax=Linnemannia gamsii TaxID=64522 RepID=A0A9P6RAU9_9FUNG|nr:hypothetical protein BGZ97_010213 [Linnemannia gamsii]
MSYHIPTEELEALLPTLTQLTSFEMDGLPSENFVQMLHSLPLLTVIAFRGDENPTRRRRITEREGFQDSGLIAIGTLLPLLKDLTVHFNKNIFDFGVGQFSRICPRLTRIDLRGCQGISSDGLASFLGAQPHMTHVSLADTLLHDGGLLVLAAPPRAAQLRVLNIRKCRLVQAHGVGQVVRACTNIRELNFSLCSAVWMEVFAGTWACLGLLRLHFGGIHGPVPAQDGSNTYFSRFVMESEREQMYAQLGRLHLLEELTLLPLPFQPLLFDLGRTAVENMTRLKHISLVDRAPALADRDIIWLATRLPSLRALDLDEYATRSTLLQDLGDINRSLKFNLLYSRDVYGVPDANLDETDDSDTDDSDTDSESESDEDGNHFFGYGGGGNDVDDDSDDDSDADSDDNNGGSYYSSDEEPYLSEYIDYYDSDLENEHANVYPSATPPSNSEDYETYSEDDSDGGGDGHGGDYFWTYRNPYYPGSDSDEPVPYCSDSQDISEGDSEEDSSEEDGSQSNDSDDSNDSDSADDDESGQSELSSDEESGTEDDDDDDEDGSEVETDVTSRAGGVGNSDDDDRSQAGGAYSDDPLSGEEGDDGSEDDSDMESEDEEQEEEDEEEQYSDEDVEEDEEEEQYSDEQDVDEEDDYYDDYVDDTDDYGGYQDYDSDADPYSSSAGEYSTDDY